MSRVGREPITLPDGVSVTVMGQHVRVTGPKGALALDVHPRITVVQEDKRLTVRPGEGHAERRGVSALWGLTRALLQNLVTGVTQGFEKRLELHGVGYRAELTGRTLTLSVGYSHPVEIAAPDTITFAVDKNVITVSGIDKHLVGEIAAQIRRVRPPEPYQGKGIRYVGEHVRRKAGKVVAATT